MLRRNYSPSPHPCMFWRWWTHQKLPSQLNGIQGQQRGSVRLAMSVLLTFNAINDSSLDRQHTFLRMHMTWHPWWKPLVFALTMELLFLTRQSELLHIPFLDLTFHDKSGQVSSNSGSGLYWCEFQCSNEQSQNKAWGCKATWTGSNKSYRIVSYLW